MVMLAVLSVTVRGSNGPATRLSVKVSSGSTLESSVRPIVVQTVLPGIAPSGTGID